MNISFSTILVAILTSNLMLILLTLLLQNSRIMMTAGYKIFIAIVLLATMRLLVPFEFPFATNIYFSKLLSKVVANIRYHRFKIHIYSLSYWNLFEIIWGAGTVIHIIHYIYTCYQFQKNIFQTGTNVTTQEKYADLLNKICTDHHAKNNFQVYQSPYVKIPMILGIRKPYILIPENLDVTSKELFYILSHETTHYFYHDLATKLFIQILCFIYWWNPVCILLKRQANLLLEMRIDEHVTTCGTVCRTEYMECILRILKSSVDDKNYPFAISLCSENKSLLIQRFQMMIKKETIKHKHLLNTGLISSVIIVYALSYLFTLEANYILPEIAETVTELSPDNTYLIQNMNGTYDVYFNQIYIETVDTLEMYQDNYPIYQSITEVNEN